MCGIVCAVSNKPVLPLLLEGLKKLEYRGYDSAGVALYDPQDTHTPFARTRSVGRIAALESALNAKAPSSSTVGIAHTRWATHGKPTELNAHPHISTDKIALVHNGIIENYQPLREELIAEGYQFKSETDTEVMVNEIHRQLSKGKDLLQAVLGTVKKLEGAYAIGVMSADEPRRIIGARSGSPMVVGIAEDSAYIASDMSALLSETRDFYVLEDGDVVDIQDGNISLLDTDGTEITREIFTSKQSAEAAQLGNYRHYMLKEIHEQPQAIADTLEGRISGTRVLEGICGVGDSAIFSALKAIQIIACGTSYNAGLVAKYWFESFGIPCQVEIASEFRSRTHVVPDECLVITLSQSGETIDTLSALKVAKRAGFKYSLSVCNVPESSLVRESDLVLMTHAGPEIGVASTKAFTTQLAALLLLVCAIGRHNNLDAEKEAAIIKELRELPGLVTEVIDKNDEIEALAEQFADKQHALFLGRGSHYPIAMEGALKLKEISYIHAEAYAAGELKHGPLALVDENMPVVAVAPHNTLIEKLKGNIEEVRARGGKMIVFADKAANLQSAENCQIIDIAAVDNMIAPIIFTIPLQLLSYHVALIKGTDVDKPRNLAKSVTVE
ncbi:MAG: glucosamine--fructose-6-phosphate aminotransferase (isomerizing) [Saprospiraceae bacterium]|jgi:glucosamine--fructose-6-phosphate aminotransferase (isomerizing)